MNETPEHVLDMKEKLAHAMLNNNQEALKLFSKIITFAVRSELDNLRRENLSDKQSKELNLAISNGIYNSLFVLSNHGRDEQCRERLNDLIGQMLSNDWNPILNSDFGNVLIKLSEPKEFQFKAPFLNEQFQIGNLYYCVDSGCLRKINSFDFKEVEGNKSKHGDKIVYYLKREGYKYDLAADGYKKYS